MLLLPVTTSNRLAAGVAVLGLLLVPMPIHAQLRASDDAHATQIEAEFRGCESAGWCRFWIESPDRFAQSQYRVRPDGVPRRRGGDAISIAVRNRLNALLSNMIHQVKHIVLHDLHKLDDGTFAATVTVNGVNLAADPILLELREKADGTIR